MAASKTMSAKRRVSARYAKAVQAEHMFEADHDAAAFEKRLEKIAKRSGRRNDSDKERDVSRAERARKSRRSRHPHRLPG